MLCKLTSWFQFICTLRTISMVEPESFFTTSHNVQVEHHLLHLSRVNFNLSRINSFLSAFACCQYLPARFRDAITNMYIASTELLHLCKWFVQFSGKTFEMQNACLTQSHWWVFNKSLKCLICARYFHHYRTTAERRVGIRPSKQARATNSMLVLCLCIDWMRENGWQKRFTLKQW